jgi:hypothetical protein
MAANSGYDYGFQVLTRDGYWIVRVHDPDVPEEEYEIVANADPNAAIVSLEDFIEQAQQALATLRRVVHEQHQWSADRGRHTHERTTASVCGMDHHARAVRLAQRPGWTCPAQLDADPAAGLQPGRTFGDQQFWLAPGDRAVRGGDEHLVLIAWQHTSCSASVVASPAPWNRASAAVTRIGGRGLDAEMVEPLLGARVLDQHQLQRRILTAKLA